MRRKGPDFERLPDGTKLQFEQRLERLPLHRVRTRIDFDAVWENEARFEQRFCARHRVRDIDANALGTWHLGAVTERLGAARPDLLPHRSRRRHHGHLAGPETRSVGPDGLVITHQTLYRKKPVTPLDRLAGRLRRLRPNFTVGWGCWFGNRWSSVRGVRVGLRAAQLRRTEGA